KAAAEMQQRAAALLNGKGRTTAKRTKQSPARPEISTFHSLCVRILRRNIRQLGYPEKFVICDRSEQETQARAVLRELRAPATALAPGDLLGYIGRWKTQSVRPHDAASIAQSERDHLAAAGYRRYQDQLKKLGAVDFDDLLLLTEDLFERFPPVRKSEAQRFDHVLIDEYQDTNHSQYAIVKGLARDHRNLCVVGDDDQSIYAWRGAEVTHILRFQQDWKEAKVVRLENNYRSTAAIIEYANTLIAFNRQRHDKTLIPDRPGGDRPGIMQCKDETEEAIRVVGHIRSVLDARKAQPRDMAILCRTNEQPRSFETELRRANVPYVLIGGMSFFDRKEVRDLLAYLKLIDNPHDEPALRRIINTPPRGIGDAAQKRLLDEATRQGKFLWDVLADAGPVEKLVVDGVDAKTADAVGRFVRLIEKFRADAAKLGIPGLVSHVINETNYRDSLHKLYPDPNECESRLASLEEIINAAASYAAGCRKSASLAGFLDDVLLNERDDSDEKESQLERNAVALMTLHSAKGLEFPRVYLVGMEEGILPHKRSLEIEGAAIDEERRLCYVGVTRAREVLTLSFALTRRKWGKPRKTIPSRFLYEMTGQADNPRSPANDGPAPAGRKGKGRGAKSPSAKSRAPRKSARR
ncbi:MAG: exodeoxyribonuclease V subunit gamma, partial [Planctomycetes bacterium]|nr:exodeoxyribonuclease V subunit gamma [Planctomycetota bacterium]